MIKNITFFLVVILLAFPVEARDGCYSRILSAEPAKLVSSMLPKFETLYASIPSLSRREEQWIMNEQAAGGDRWVQVTNSREFILQRAKMDAGSLLRSVRKLARKTESERGESATIYWLRLTYQLIDGDTDAHLAILIDNRLIERKQLPDEWNLLGRDLLQLGIRSGRTSLAQHILLCILPTVMGISAID